jgi:hypothetical protein
MTDENTIKTVGVEGGIPIAQWINQIGTKGDWKTALRTAGVYGFQREVKLVEGKAETVLTFMDNSILRLIGEDEVSPTASFY